MKILVLGNSNIFKRKLYPAISKFKKLELELASRRKISKNMNIHKSYKSYDFAIKTTKAKTVYISLINSEHFKWALKSLNSGKNVIVDKPLTLSLKKTKKLINIASKKKLLLSEAIVFHKHTQFKKMFSKINLKKKTKIFCEFHIPKLEKGNFRNYKKYGGGCFYDMSSYASSIIYLFFKNKKYLLNFKMKKNKSNINESFELKAKSKNIYLEASFSFNSLYKNQILIYNQNKKYFINYAFSPPINKSLKLEIFVENLKKKYHVKCAKQNVFYTYFKEVFNILRKKKYNFFYKEIENIAKIKKKFS